MRSVAVEVGVKMAAVALGLSLAAHVLALLALGSEPADLSRPAAAPFELFEPEGPSPLAPALAPRPAARPDTSATRPAASARGASRPSGGSPVRASQASGAGAVAVDVGEEEASGEAAASGAGRYYDAWKVEALPAPRTLPSMALAGTGTAGRIDLDVTVTASGRVGGVVALGSPRAELASAVARALSEVRFSPAMVDGTPVSTTVPVTVVLLARDGGASGWVAGGTGWVLRLE